MKRLFISLAIVMLLYGEGYGKVRREMWIFPETREECEEGYVEDCSGDGNLNVVDLVEYVSIIINQ